MLKQNQLLTRKQKCNCSNNIIQRIKNLIEIRIAVDRALEATRLIAFAEDFSKVYSNPDDLQSNIKDIYSQLVIICSMVNSDQ